MVNSFEARLIVMNIEGKVYMQQIIFLLSYTGSGVFLTFDMGIGLLCSI